MSNASSPIRSDDPQALEKLTARLNALESATPRNSAAILETKKRIRKQQRIEDMPHEEGWFPGGRYQTNEESYRIQFVFEQIPDQDTKQELSRLGFRGAKDSLVYQSPRTPKYIRRARRLAEQLREPFPRNLSRQERARLLVYANAILSALNHTDPAGQISSSDSSKGNVADQIASRFTDLEGVTITIKGAQTDTPVIWLSGNTKSHEAEIEKRGGKWSVKRSAWYANSRTVKGNRS